MRVSKAQYAMMKALLKAEYPDAPPSRYGWGAKFTHPTGNALKRRGYAHYEADVTSGLGRWVLTDVGRSNIVSWEATK